MIFLEKVLNIIRTFYEQTDYDFMNPITINNLVESTQLSENEISKIVKELEIKDYIAVLRWKDKEGDEFYLKDLGKQKILNLRWVKISSRNAS